MDSNHFSMNFHRKLAEYRFNVIIKRIYYVFSYKKILNIFYFIFKVPSEEKMIALG